MFVDIHSHIIPFIDDGAENITTALDMLKLAAADGTSHIFATPHYISGAVQNTSELILNRCSELQNMAVDKGINIGIHPGCEVFISPDLPKLFDSGVINTLSSSSFILVELPMMNIPPYTDEVLFSLQLRGITPIIAHPERNKEILRNWGFLVDLVRRGILLQANSSSITGIFGKKTQNFAMKLIKAGMTQFVASDAHTCRGRSPRLGKAAEIVGIECGAHIVERLFYKNGLAVIENRNVTVQELTKDNGGTGWFGSITNSAKAFFETGF